MSNPSLRKRNTNKFCTQLPKPFPKCCKGPDGGSDSDSVTAAAVTGAASSFQKGNRRKSFRFVQSLHLNGSSFPEDLWSLGRVLDKWKMSSLEKQLVREHCQSLFTLLCSCVSSKAYLAAR